MSDTAVKSSSKAVKTAAAADALAVDAVENGLEVVALARVLRVKEL